MFVLSWMVHRQQWKLYYTVFSYSRAISNSKCIAQPETNFDNHDNNGGYFNDNHHNGGYFDDDDDDNVDNFQTHYVSIYEPIY